MRAPCDGYATNIELVPGAVVSAAASVLPFVCDRDERNLGIVVTTFMQGPCLRINPGDYAEVVFPMYPGQVFPRMVLTTIDLASEGQLSASGLFPGANAGHGALCCAHQVGLGGKAALAGRHASSGLYGQCADGRNHPHGPDAHHELDQFSILQRLISNLKPAADRKGIPRSPLAYRKDATTIERQNGQAQATGFLPWRPRTECVRYCRAAPLKGATQK